MRLFDFEGLDNDDAPGREANRLEHPAIVVCIGCWKKEKMTIVPFLLPIKESLCAKTGPVP